MLFSNDLKKKIVTTVAASSFFIVQVNLLKSITEFLCERAVFELTFERREIGVVREYFATEIDFQLFSL